METLCLSDLLDLDQTEAARRMDISQSTFHRILAGARRKVVASVVRGHPLTVARAWDADMSGVRVQRDQEKITGGTSMIKRIALPTDDGTTLCQHFGRARYYKVIDLTDGVVTATELRDKFAHVCGDASLDSGLPHEEVHKRLAEAAHGCDTVIAGGMGGGAMDALLAAGLKVIQTDMSSLDEIVEAFRTGRLVNVTEQPHSSHHEGEGHGNC
jgi:predicted Fe-Mo cluster-binding NifX family protein